MLARPTGYPFCVGFRFHRGVGIGRFLRLNFGKKGVSLSAGVPGARVNLGARGVRVSAGIPGSGLSWSSRVGGPGPGAHPAGPGAGAPQLPQSPRPWVATDYPASWPTKKAAAEYAAREQERQAWERHQHFEAEKRRVEAHEAAEKAQRWQWLVATFGQDAAIKIHTKQLWVGATDVMVLEMLGAPEDTDDVVLKTKSKEIWKYFQKGENRFGLRVTLEDGAVVGWTDKR